MSATWMSATHQMPKVSDVNFTEADMAALFLEIFWLNSLDARRQVVRTGQY